MDDMEMITMSVDDIVPYENNPRKNEGAVAAVAESIKQCGYVAPIIVDENNIILAGHTRLQAVKSIGGGQIPVIVRRGLTENQKRKYRLLDNKTAEFAMWDLDKLEIELEGLDFDDFDFGFEIDEEKPKERTTAKYSEAISVVIDCESDEEAETIFNALTEEGYNCHISTL